MNDQTLRIGVATSTDPDTASALASTWASLAEQIGGEPDLLIAVASEPYELDEIRGRLVKLAPNAALHGYTSCLGVMGPDGFASENGRGLGLWGLTDPGTPLAAAYGSASVEIGDDPRGAGTRAIRAALDAAGRPGELPALVWMTATPGLEEEVMAGVGDVIGHHVPIIGGSAADNEVAGQWAVFSVDQTLTDGVVLTALFPSTPVAFSFFAGYEASQSWGTATATDGRTVLEIEGRPAAQVYNEWCHGLVDQSVDEGGVILGDTTLHPLGREVGRVGDEPYFQLAHPASIRADGGLDFFATVQQGETLVLMRGTEDGLVDRAGQVAFDAMATGGMSPDDVAGALVQYCAGCMLTVTDRMDAVAANVREELSGSPFLGTFTFGEQGCFVGGENRHGNLMVSAVVFAAKPTP